MFRILVTALSCLIATPLLAQGAAEMTEAEILEALKKQKTRGLVIAPVPDAGTATTGGTNVTGVAPAETQGGAAETAPATVAAAPLDAVPRDEQVNMNISFDFDSAALREDQKPVLATLCRAMEAAEIETFRILGHTDASGSAEYNERLSLLRAQEVKRHLTENCAIAPERMQAIGVGEQFPFDADDPRGDVNRRVEFQVIS